MSVAGIIVGKSFITAMVNGATQTITDQHPNYARIREAVKIKDYDAVERLINISKSVANYATGKVRVESGRVFYGNDELHGAVVDRILDMMREGFDAQPMLNFLDNLMQNPSKRAVDELYLFLEQTSLPITEDGHFLAYKKVDENYLDFYTGKMDNSIGKILEMPRNAVDDNRDRTCSEGLHFCSLTYLPHYHGGRGRVMIVKINPADVVSIPSDYNNAKGRTCRYEVIGEHTSEVTEFYTRPVYTDLQPEADGDEFDDRDEFEVEADEVRRQGYEAGYESRMDGDEYDDLYYGDMEDQYQEGYEEGWDDAGSELAKRAAQTSNKPSIMVNKAATQTIRTGLEGYNQGRSDAAAGRRYDADLKRDGQAYADGYAKGWDYYKQGR
jgi:hypothetical protein